jgi:hypothetical protein
MLSVNAVVIFSHLREQRVSPGLEQELNDGTGPINARTMHRRLIIRIYGRNTRTSLIGQAAVRCPSLEDHIDNLKTQPTAH